MLDRDPEQAGEELLLEAAWLVEHAATFPWEALNGSVLLTHTGQELEVLKSESRQPHIGPLLHVRAAHDSNAPPRMFGINKFNPAGEVKAVRASPTLRAEFGRISKEMQQKQAALVERDRRVRAEREESERRQVAERKAIQRELVDYRREAEEVERRHYEAMREYQEQQRPHRLEILTRRMREAQKRDANELRAVLDRQEITSLLHFTRVENLPGIFAIGIQGRSHLGVAGVTCIPNDTQRLDEFPEASCFSIGFPNYLMFYKYRCSDTSQRWAVIEVSSAILTELPCLFFPTNAGSSRFHQDGDVQDRIGYVGLNALFQDEPTGIRAERNLLPTWPTDPQAEVLAFEPVKTDCFLRIHLDAPNHAIENLVAEHMPRLPIIMRSTYFSPRGDFAYWKK